MRIPRSTHVLRLLSALAVVAMLAGACGGASQEAAPTTTSTSEKPSGTTTTRSSTTTSTALPALPVDPGIIVHATPDIADADIAIVLEGVTAARAAMGETAPLDVFIYVDPAAYAQEFLDRFGPPAGGRNQVLEWLANNSMAGYPRQQAVLFLNGATIFRSYGSGKNAFVTSAHESIHTTQHIQMGRQVNTPDTEVPAGGPMWLIEGQADYTAFKVAIERGQLDHWDTWDELRAGALVRNAKALPDPLSALTTYSAQQGREVDALYAKATMAAEWLAHRAGDEAVNRTYWLSALRDGWHDAFTATFGLDVDSFYAEFEAWAAAGYPQL